MRSRPRCEWREGEVFSINEKARQCGVERDTLRGAIFELRSALGEYKALPSGVRIDTPRPDVRGDKAFGGFWVGVYEGSDVVVIVKPRVERYGDMLERLERIFGDVGWIFLTASSLYAAGSRLAIYGDATRLLKELWFLSAREPRFLARRIVGFGSRIDVKERGIYIYGRRREKNRALANAVVLGVRRIIEATENAEELAEELPPGIKPVVDRYLASIRRGAAAIAEELGDMVSWADGEELGPYWHVAANAVRGHVWSQKGGAGRFVMIPSTKLYELYVYSVFAERLGPSFRECGPLCLKVAGVHLYFNAAPLSRLVRRLSGRRPKPDVAFKTGQSIAVVEAKYRELRDRKLGLPDAVRIAAYLADVARNGRLKAVIASLSKPEGEDQIVARIGDGVEAAVYYAEINPDSSQDDVRSALAFLTSER